MAPSPPILSICHRCLLRRLFPSPLPRRPVLGSTYRGLIGRRYATSAEEDFSPEEFRKEYRKSMKTRYKEKHKHEKVINKAIDQSDSKWIITVGLEIHAQLNTKRKLFSDARTSHTAPPNTHISLFDASLPGTQPTFNPAVLLPALRAALALKCTPARASRFDRKHYFYWDQPAGYQITQFYAPLATNGWFDLYQHDGFAPLEQCTGSEDNPVRIEIQQIQLEQDTGKTIASPPYSLIDLNRVGSPLVEIITRPFDCPDATFPALAMKKIQANLKAVDACVLGMEWGGLRADVNVSVRLRNGPGVLGKRCEIKNVASLKAVQEAVDSEAKRQIAVLEAGGVVEGETRGWDAEKGVTRRLRGKEGEVDYRFMPDPDLAPVFISEGLVEKIKQTIPLLPDKILSQLMSPPYNLKLKDAKTLMLWDEARASSRELGVMQYYKDILKRVHQLLLRNQYKKSEINTWNNYQIRAKLEMERRKLKMTDEIGRLVGNWVIHELGGQLTTRNLTWKENPMDMVRMADLVFHVVARKITGSTGKHLLSTLLSTPTETRSVREIITDENLLVDPATNDELHAIAERIMTADEKSLDILAQLRDPKGEVTGRPLTGKKRRGLSSYFVGMIMREVAGRVEAERVKEAVWRVVGREEEEGE